MDNKKLLLILFVLLAIYGANKIFNKPSVKSFKEELVRLDTSKIDKIILSNPEDDNGSISLIRNGNNWKAEQGSLSVTATKLSVQRTLSQAAYIKTIRLVARNKDKWEQYEVDDTNGTIVQVFGNGKELTSFITGRINFNQQTRSATSYVRLADDDDTYTADGFLSMAFNQGFNSFRDRKISALIKDDITKIELKGNRNIKLSKTGNHWADQDGVTIDSINMVKYLNGVSNVYGTTFNDNFNPDSSRLLTTLSIEANNQLTPLVIRSYTLNDSTFIISSSENSEGQFESDSSGIYQKLIIDINEIYKPVID